MENALHIDKALGDILGMAAFAILLGLTRIAYAKFGKNIFKTLLIGMIGATACYLVVGLFTSTIPVFIACVLTGAFTAMLWPGTLIMMEEKMPKLGVSAYALMAAGGDMGASVAPQLLGYIVDKVSVSGFGKSFAVSMNVSPEQIGMKTGMLVTAVFPILGVVVLLFTVRCFRKMQSEK
jgi:MFS family permease